MTNMRASMLAAVAAVALAAQPAQALTFAFQDIGGVAGTPAAGGFVAAAKFWSSIVTNNVTVRINIGFEDLGPNVLGATSSRLTLQPIQGVSNRLAFFGSNSSVDQTVRNGGLPALTTGQFGVGAVSVVTPGYVDPLNQLGIDNTTAVLDNDGSFNNSVIAVSTANAKALGYNIGGGADATITFSSTFPFDFNATDGITTGQFDFLAVAIHEIGHALGFLSGADDYDFLGCPNGPGCAAFSDYAVNDDWWGYTLDLFRYGTSFDGQNRLDWRPGVNSYFSVDGGASQYGSGSRFAEGSFHGAAGDQASHWFAPTQPPFCAGLLGVMNPYICGGVNGIFTDRDLAAFDAIGWNFNLDAGDRPALSWSTAAIAQAVGVPEPAIWAQLIAGFGLAGAAARRRRMTRVTA